MYQLYCTGGFPQSRELRKLEKFRKSSTMTRWSNIPVVMQRPVPTVRTVQRAVQAAQFQPVVLQRQMPKPITQAVDRPVPVPQVRTQQTHVPVLHVMTLDVVRQIPDVPVPQPFVQMVEKFVEVPQVYRVERIYPLPHVMMREVLVLVAVPQVQIVDVPVVRSRQTPTTQKVPKMLKSPQVQSIDKVVNFPVMALTGPLGPESSEDGGDAPDPVHRQGG